MTDVLEALIPPVVVGGVIIAFVIWLFRSQLGKKSRYDLDEGGTEQSAGDDTNQ